MRDRLTETMRREASASRAGAPRSGAPNRSASPSRGNIPGVPRGARADETFKPSGYVALGPATRLAIIRRLVETAEALSELSFVYPESRP